MCNMNSNSTPHAYPSNGEAHQAGSFCFQPIRGNGLMSALS